MKAMLFTVQPAGKISKINMINQRNTMRITVIKMNNKHMKNKLEAITLVKKIKIQEVNVK